MIVERWNAVTRAWLPLAASALLLAASPADATELLISPADGWLQEARYRVTLTSELADPYGRHLLLSDGDPTFQLHLEIPSDGSPPLYSRTFQLSFDSAKAASSTLSGAFPGGQNHLFHGLWTDPVTGLAYARARWYDPRNAAWLSEDPAQDIDSPNLYAFVAHQPHMYMDPLGLQATPEEADPCEGLPDEVLSDCREAMRSRDETLATVRKVGEVGVAVSEVALGLTALAPAQSVEDWQRGEKKKAALDLGLMAGGGQVLRIGGGVVRWGARHADEAVDVGRRMLRGGEHLRGTRRARQAGFASANTAEELRNLPGIAYGGFGHPVVSGRWMRGTHGNVGPMPQQVAAALRGRTFKDFKEFREEFWRTVASDKELSKGWTIQNLEEMRAGRAPWVRSEQELPGRYKYELHHTQPIWQSGDVYNLDNIVVVTPRYHAEVLDPAYHAGR